MATPRQQGEWLLQLRHVPGTMLLPRNSCASPEFLLSSTSNQGLTLRAAQRVKSCAKAARASVRAASA
jgi:hypothetical protein